MNRRAFLALPALLPLSRADFTNTEEHHFRYDHVIGTSLDLVIGTSNPETAQRTADAVLTEIHRLSSILSTRDPGSEIRKHSASAMPRSRALGEVFAAYDRWERRTNGAISIRPGGPGTPLNVDALGKAYIIDRALVTARESSPSIDSVVVNIGGDIAIWGRDCDIAVVDPRRPYDNADPLTRLSLRNVAIATSGTYSRGAHLLDPHTGEAVMDAPSATVTARDAVTANALATALCVAGADAGLSLVESTPGSEALVVSREGVERRSSGFSRLEQTRFISTAAVAAWPAGYQLTMSLDVLQVNPRRGGGERGGYHRPYVGVWAEDATTKLIRVLALWADKPKYYGELSILLSRAKGNTDRLFAVARATRIAGKYDLVWDGLDDQRMPVAPGPYKIIVEVNQEGGSYTKQSGIITCGDAPAELKLSGTANFEPVTIQYGPKAAQA